MYANTNVTVVQITKDGKFKVATNEELNSDEFLLLISGTLVDGFVSPVSRHNDDLVSFHFGLLQVSNVSLL